MPSEAQLKARASKELFEREEAYIESLIKTGHSINQIMRKLRITTDYTIRKWIRENRPDLYEIVLQNGLRRLHRKDIKGVSNGNCPNNGDGGRYSPV